MRVFRREVRSATMRRACQALWFVSVSCRPRGARDEMDAFWSLMFVPSERLHYRVG